MPFLAYKYLPPHAKKSSKALKNTKAACCRREEKKTKEQRLLVLQQQQQKNLMARSLLKANLVAAVADTVSLFSISTMRRGYSISSTSNAVVRGRSAEVVKAGEEVKKMVVDSNSWVPDPVTGYYRPGNLASDVDVAELRRILLTHKLHQN